MARALALHRGRRGRRHPDRDRLRAGRRRDQRRGGGAHLRGQGPAALQPADRPCRRSGDGRARSRCSTRCRSRLAQAFWPGPLTLVLPLRPGNGIHPLVTAGLDTIALRMPKGFGARADRRARPAARRAQRQFVGQDQRDHAPRPWRPISATRIPLIVDGGATPVGLESTIVKVEGETLRLLRPGGIAAEEIEARRRHAAVARRGSGHRGARHARLALCAGRRGAAQRREVARRGAARLRRPPRRRLATRRRRRATCRATGDLREAAAICSRCCRSSTERRGDHRRRADPVRRARRGDQRPALAAPPPRVTLPIAPGS